DRLRATGLAIYTVVWSSAAGLLSGTFGGMIYQEAGRFTFYMVAVGFSLLAFAGFLGQHLLDTHRDSLRYFKNKNKKTSL
ncbi:MAG TPA: MFS transporter, partial [Paenibacillus sp.]|nr:MFS transporter [Paenibacillus sp.]